MKAKDLTNGQCFRKIGGDQVYLVMARAFVDASASRHSTVVEVINRIISAAVSVLPEE